MSFAGAVTPPPPDVLRPPESPFKRSQTEKPASGGAGGVEVEGEGEDWDVDAELDTVTEEQSDIEPARRESMYVKLFDEMINAVLDGEEYLFTRREAWVLRYILALPYEPRYLLTRLLLRRAGRVFALSSLVDAYSGEIGEEGVKRATRTLAAELDVPPSILEEEGEEAGSSTTAGAAAGQSISSSASASTSVALASLSTVPAVASIPRPWAVYETYLSREEEDTDPDYAEALRQSLWAVDTGLDPSQYLQACEASAGGASGSGIGASGSGSGSITGLNGAGDSPAEDSLPTEDESPGPIADFSLQPLPSAPITHLAHDDPALADLMACIPVEELRRVARGRKIPLSLLNTRESTIIALKDFARRQTTLNFGGFTGKGKGKAKEGAPGASTSTSEHMVVAQLLPLVGGHVLQIDRELYILITRVNLIFSRTPPATSQPALLLPPILVQSNKRHYPSYTPTRSKIWTSRDEMLIWERAVTWETLVSEALGDIWSQVRMGTGGPSPNMSIFAPRGQPLPRTECAKHVRKVWAEAWPIWKSMVGAEVPQRSGGDRFRTEHVLTRVVHKGSEALGILHEYDLECEVLRALLAQRRWRRGKRGAWYERLALVLMTHYRGNPAEQRDKLEEAAQTCIDGLLDDDTHLIYRPGLSRRLTRLEHKLNLPADERHISYAQLMTCETRELVAVRSSQNTGIVRTWSNNAGSVLDGDEDLPLAPAQVGKSVWVGRDGEVTVEGWVLEWWEDKGYKGYHAESSILTTLFALLMWPVLFHPVPGAFETAYQTAPLDLGEDSFSRSRRDMMEQRLEEMQDTAAALAMLRETDARERPRATWAVGLNWDYGAVELEEILECMGGQAVSMVCRMLGEDYRHRASGVPDLIVWDYAAREARFVEVKGPGDNLSGTQKIWIDVLTSAGVPVEVCRVKDKGREEEDARIREEKGKTRKKATPTKKRPSLRGNRSGSSGSGSGRKMSMTATESHSARLKRKISTGSGGASADEPIVLSDSDDEVKRRKV